jgi:hypothetical protein
MEISTKRQPLLWQCPCGWLGRAQDMTLGYHCPKCGAFEEAKIVVMPRLPGGGWHVTS